MNQQLDLLDLSITLNPPPQGSQSDAIASIVLNCSATLNLNHAGDILATPLTEKERSDLRWYLEEYWKWPYEGFAKRGKEVEALLIDIGKRLYKAVFGSVDAVEVIQAWRLQPDVTRQISIISAMPAILSLPWELLHDERGFLALRTRNPVTIIRRLPQNVLAEFTTPFEPPLRVLLVTARPEGTGFLDPRGVARELLDEMEDQVKAGTVALEFLRPPTLTALRNRLEDTTRPVHILHFDGHGIFEGEVVSQSGVSKSGGGQGKLAFEHEDGKLDLVEAGKLAQVLQDSGVRLAVLDACQSAMGSGEDAFSSVATRLIQGGVDNVVAMSASVLVTATTRYFEKFYRELVGGVSTPTAQERARQALHDEPRRHMQQRRRDVEGQPVELQDWWLPHFYQQRPLVLRATRPSDQLDLQPTPSERLSESMPAEPRYGFSGRAYELLRIERRLMRGQLVVIHGFGGVGKTALVRETADWLTRTKMYDAACFVSFEHGGDASVLLSTLGTFLGVYDGHYNPNDAKAALAKLEPALKQKRTLVIADNMESILPGGDAQLEAGLRSQLWDVLLKLSNMGAGMLLTTRDTNFGDGKMEPGKYVAHLALAGLHPEDSYALASRLLEYLGIDRAKAPYVELRDLLKQLDYHPLAIQLVLPALRETSLSLAKIKADFAALLPKFVDDTETGRNRSLLASLDFSLRRLSQKQRSLLPRLALFEGGTLEENLLAITEISESEWAKLRPALEQEALITAEEVGGFTAPFLRFHPVLAPYLRSLQGADDEALHERYVKRYHGLANYLYDEDSRNPQAVRALVRLELPNLRRALELLLDAGELGDASEMADRIAKFLNDFGFGRELEDLRLQVEKAVTTSKIQNDGKLTYAEYLRESGLGEDEWRKGNLGAAYARFTRLLQRIEALPEGISLGRGSYQHCIILQRLARCLIEGGQPAVAEERLRRALVVVDALLKQQSNDLVLIRQRGVLLTDLGTVLTHLGLYSHAQRAHEEALEIDKQLGDLAAQSVDLSELGLLNFVQRNYSEARSRYLAALEIDRALVEYPAIAKDLNQLGMIAKEQKDWTTAERYYRESLSINERLSDIVGVARACNNLAISAEESGRPTEAEGWYKRVLELDEVVQLGSATNALHLSNLASLLLNEVREGHIPKIRLAEARGYAEQALAIREKLDASSQIWTTLHLLADIADLEGRSDEAQNHRRRERETYVAFEGNRYHIDRQHGQLIADIAVAAKDDTEARAKIEAALSRLEANGWHIADAVQRIWAGEQDWDSLVENLDRQDALLILRVLETIAQPAEAQSVTPEQIIASLPDKFHEALEQGDEVAIQQAFDALSTEEQQAVMEAMQYFQSQQKDDDEEE